MITKSDWRAVNQLLMAGDRERLGDPPTAEELLAYTRAELSAEDEERVRERLVCHPDLVRTITEPFPTEGATPGDPDFLSDDEFAQHWASMQKRMKRAAPPREGGVVRLWQVATALAASLAIVFGALLWQELSESREPRVLENQILLPDGTRGAENQPPVLTAKGDRVVLSLVQHGSEEFEQYRIEIRNVSTNETVWTSVAASPDESDHFSIVVRRRSLAPGTYRIVVYGRAAAAEEPVHAYSIRVRH